MDEIDGVNAMPEVAAALRRFYLSNPQNSCMDATKTSWVKTHDLVAAARLHSVLLGETRIHQTDMTDPISKIQFGLGDADGKVWMHRQNENDSDCSTCGGV